MGAKKTWAFILVVTAVIVLFSGCSTMSEVNYETLQTLQIANGQTTKDQLVEVFGYPQTMMFSTGGEAWSYQKINWTTLALSTITFGYIKPKTTSMMIFFFDTEGVVRDFTAVVEME